MVLNRLRRYRNDAKNARTPEQAMNAILLWNELEAVVRLPQKVKSLLRED